MPLDTFTDHADTHTPPLSPAFEMDPTSFSVFDLSYQMSRYSLQQSEHCSASPPQSPQYDGLSPYTYPSRPSTPPTEPSSASSTASSSSILNPSSALLPQYSASSRVNSGYYTANVRQQRQRALRRQCSASHLREISALVSRMVNEGDQCSVGATPMAGSRARHNSDPTSDSSCGPTADEISGDEYMEDSTEEGDSEPEAFNDACEGFKIQEATGFIHWHSPWASKPRCADGKCGVKKDTRSRKRMRRRLQTPA